METHTCVYCGDVAVHQLKNGRWCCCKSSNSCPVRRRQAANKRNEDGTPKRDYKKIYENLPEDTKTRIKNACIKAAKNPLFRVKQIEILKRRYASGELIPALKGKKHNIQAKQKMKRAALERIAKFGITIYHPNFNKSACEYIDGLNISNGWHLQHAMNGGEVQIDNYFLDGYDKELNIAFEYDEPHHYTNIETNTLRLEDVERMNLIHAKLKCRFFRYNEGTCTLYEYQF